MEEYDNDQEEGLANLPVRRGYLKGCSPGRKYESDRCHDNSPIETPEEHRARVDYYAARVRDGYLLFEDGRRSRRGYHASDGEE